MGYRDTEQLWTIKYRAVSIQKMLQEIAANAPPVGGLTEPLVIWLEENIRIPLEGTLFDQWIALPIKEYYIAAKRRE